MKLTPEDFDRLETKKLANVIRKLQKEKTLTAREEAILAQARAGTEPTASSGYAKNWDELAQRIGTTRRAIQQWRKDPRYKADCPKSRADGRHDVAAWGAFMVKHGLKRADEHVDNTPKTEENAPDGVIQPPLIAGSQADWKKAESHIAYERKRDALEVSRRNLLVATDLEIPLGATLAAIQTKLSQFPARVARFVVGLRDAQEVEDRLRDEIDADLSDLQAATYVSTVPGEVVAELPDLGPADRSRLEQLLAECLARIGRRALTSEISSPPISDPGPLNDDSPRNNSAEIVNKLPLKGDKISGKRKRKPPEPPAEVAGAMH